MSNVFKVGQRVWSITFGMYMFISQIELYGCFLSSDETLYINYWHTYDEFRGEKENGTKQSK